MNKQRRQTAHVTKKSNRRTSKISENKRGAINKEKISTKRNAGFKKIINSNPNLDVTSLIPIDFVDAGIIKTKSAKYLKIIEVLPINFNMRSSDEKIGVVSNFMSLFYQVKNHIQFKVISTKTDTSAHENSIIQAAEEDGSHSQDKLLEAYLNFVRELGRKSSVSRRFFISIEYIKDNNGENSFQNIWESLNNDANAIASCLIACGNDIVEHDTVQEETFATLEILYFFLNSRSSFIEPFESRFSRILHDCQIAQHKEDPNTVDLPIAALIAPRGLDFSHKDYVVSDGEYLSYFYVKSSGYPKTSLKSGWAGNFLSFGEGINFDIFLQKYNSETLENKLWLYNKSMENSFGTRHGSDKDYGDVLEKYESQNYIKEALRDEEELFDMCIFFTVHAPTLKELRTKVKSFKNRMRASGFILNCAVFKQKEMFISTLPFLEVNDFLFKHARRNITTSGLAGSFFLSAFEMCDNNGVLLGLNAQNGSLFIMDQFNSKEYKNANMAVLGTSGAGKTFLLQMLAGRYRLRGYQVYAILPLKGHEFERGVTEYNGAFINLSPGSKHCINILDVIPYDNTQEKLLHGDEYEMTDSLLVNKMNQVLTWFCLIKPDITQKEQTELQLALQDTYAEKGILTKNETLYNKDGSIKTMPILVDLYNNLHNIPGREGLADALEQFVHGNSRNLNAQTNVDLSNKYICFDVSKTPDALLPSYMFIALDFIWTKTKQNTAEHKVIILDELWKLINCNEKTANFVLEIFKIIRGLGGAAWAATQDISDFFGAEDGKFGKGILNSCKTKILLNFEEDESHTVAEALNLTRSERILLTTRKNKGEGLVCCNNNKIHFLGRPTQYEYDLYTTDANDKARQIQRIQAEKNRKEFESATDLLNQLPSTKDVE